MARFHTPAKLRVADPVGNRFQDQILGSLGPIVDWLNAYPPRFTTSTRPTANESWAGVVIRLKDDGAADTLQVCLEQADGTFAWCALGEGGSSVPGQYTTATAPTASAEWEGQFIRIKDSGADEKLWVCLQTSTGGYQWLTSDAGSESSWFGPLFPVPGI